MRAGMLVSSECPAATFGRTTPRWRTAIRQDSMDTTQHGPFGSNGVALAQPLLTAADIAGLLGLPRSSVYDYARRKYDPLPSVGIGRHRRFVRRDVEVWLAAHRSS